MKYEIFGGHFPAVTVYLDRGEKIFTQTGGLAWMSDRVAMDTNMKGGFLAGFWGNFLAGFFWVFLAGFWGVPSPLTFI